MKWKNGKRGNGNVDDRRGQRLSPEVRQFLEYDRQMTEAIERHDRMRRRHPERTREMGEPMSRSPRVGDVVGGRPPMRGEEALRRRGVRY